MNKNDFKGCEIIFITNDEIDIECQDERQAERLKNYLSGPGLGFDWKAYWHEREVHFEKPHPEKDVKKIVDALTKYHGIDLSAEKTAEEFVKELIDDYGLTAENWDYVTQSAEFANSIAPEIRRFAGCEDNGTGTYTDCSEGDSFREDEIYNILLERLPATEEEENKTF